MTATVISMFKGNTNSVRVSATYTDSDGATAPIDVTGSTTTFTVKTQAGVQVLQKSGSVVSPGTNGVFDFSFVPADTTSIPATRYVYDVKIVTATSQVYTVARGTFQLRQA